VSPAPLPSAPVVTELRVMLPLLPTSLAVTVPLPMSPEPAVASIQVSPESLELRGQRARFSLLVDGTTADDRTTDVTRRVMYQSLTPDVCSVSPAGVVTSGATGGFAAACLAHGQRAFVGRVAMDHPEGTPDWYRDVDAATGALDI